MKVEVRDPLLTRLDGVERKFLNVTLTTDGAPAILAKFCIIESREDFEDVYKASGLDAPTLLEDGIAYWNEDVKYLAGGADIRLPNGDLFIFALWKNKPTNMKEIVIATQIAGVCYSCLQTATKTSSSPDIHWRLVGELTQFFYEHLQENKR